MVRKSIVSALLFLYSLSAIGVPLHMHYCKGELKHVTLFLKTGCHETAAGQQAYDCCKKQGPHCATDQAGKTCCNDDTQWLQEDIPVILAENMNLNVDSNVLIPALPLSSFAQNIEGTDLAVEIQYPPGTDPPCYVMYCSLIFYG